MAQRILRPLTYGDLFDEAFDLYKSKFVTLVGIAAVVNLPMSLLAVFAMTPFYNFSATMPRPGQPLPQAFPDYSQFIYVIGISLLLGVVWGLLNLFVLGASTWAVSRSYLGRDATIADSYQAIGRKAAPFGLTVFLAGVVTYIGFILCIIPGVLLGFMLAFITQVCLVENRYFFSAAERSKILADGQWLRIFVVAILAGLLVAVCSAVLSAPAQIILTMSMAHGVAPSAAALFVSGVWQGVARSLVWPIGVIAFVLLYYDVRVRKEGFDIQMLAESMGVEPAASEQPPQSPA